MSHRFQHHYTAAEATALIPKLARWLEEMRLLRQSLDRQGERLAELLDDSGDQGGSRVNTHARGLVRWRELAAEFSHRGLQIRDFEAGKIDFPSLRGDREIFLVWQEGESKVEAWREISELR